MLKFYIISTVCCWLVFVISEQAINNRSKREEVKVFDSIHYSIWEKLFSSLPLFIPIFNIILALIMIFYKDAIYEELAKQNNK